MNNCHIHTEINKNCKYCSLNNETGEKAPILNPIYFLDYIFILIFVGYGLATILKSGGYYFVIFGLYLIFSGIAIAIEIILDKKKK